MSCKMKTLVALLALLVAAPAAFGALAAIGPINPVNGFPLFVQDANGLALQLNLDPALGVFDPPIAGNAFSQQIGFGTEAFFWSADALIDIPPGGALPQGGQALLVLAVEAAFANGAPADGDQFLFGRVRIRVDVPLAGNVTVTHPFGQQTFNVATPGVRAINETLDVGGFAANPALGIPNTMQAVLAAPVGPFLTAVNPAPPAGFIGNPLIDQTVTGSPTGNNFFRVRGGGIDAQTDLFAVQGQISTATLPPVGATGATAIARTPFVDVTASAPTGTQAIVELPATPAGPRKRAGTAQRVVMNETQPGVFFCRLQTPAFNNLPPQVNLTTTDPVTGTPTTVGVPITDQVQIIRAMWNQNSKMLMIVAMPSNRTTPFNLSEQTYGPFTNQAGRPTGTTLIRTGVQTPPATVTVTSANGGSTTAPVQVVGFVRPAAAPAAAPPAAP